MIGNKIRRPGTLHRWVQGARNADTGDYGPATFTDVPVYVEIQQQTTREYREGRQVVTGEWIALFRPEVVLGSNDEVSVEPEGRFAFEGDPWLVVRPSTQQGSHWFARLRKVE